MLLKISKTTKLKGCIRIGGSKNATLPLMVTHLLTDEMIVLNNVPCISDVENMIKILKSVGSFIDFNKEKKTLFLKRDKQSKILDSKLISQIRASYYIMGAYIARGINFKIKYPGGCSFSKRPIDYHLDAFKKMGYEIYEKFGLLSFKKVKKYPKRLMINLEKQSVGATINILLAGSIQSAITTITNASVEPEVLDVISLLNKMGTFVEVIENKIIIYGSQNLKGANHKVISDRIETGSYMLLASAVEESEVVLKNVDLCYLSEVINVIKQLGVSIETSTNEIKIIKEKQLKGINLIVDVYPHFPTDLQQLLCVVCTQAKEKSIIIDNVYPDRTTQIMEINKARGNVLLEEKKIYIYPTKLVGTTVKAHDLRCGFACIIMGAIAENQTYIEDSEYIFRGYEELIYKLKSLGIEAILASN